MRNSERFIIYIGETLLLTILLQVKILSQALAEVWITLVGGVDLFFLQKPVQKDVGRHISFRLTQLSRYIDVVTSK